jgi:GNAT superfamily N-acetyltransferase
MTLGKTLMNVRPVLSKRDLARFIELPYALHRGDPSWVPPLRLTERARFSRNHPFFEHAAMQLFLAEERGRVVGRVAAIDDRLHNETHGDNLAFFGFFEAQSEASALALLTAVEAWARARGRTAVRGPANPSMNDGSGFQIDAFGTPPYVMMPWNPPAYPHYMARAGYDKVKDLYAWFFDHHGATGAAVERLERLAARVKKRYPVKVRPVDLQRFDAELAIVERLYNGAWEENWGFVRYTEAEFAALARELRLILDPEIAIFVELAGEPVGLALALPDVNQVCKKMNGRLLPFGFWHLLRRRQLIDQARLPILGVIKAHRHKGLELVLIYEIIRRSRARGYRRGECSWILEDNEAMNKGIAAAGAERYKTYRLYQKTL